MASLNWEERLHLGSHCRFGRGLIEVVEWRCLWRRQEHGLEIEVVLGAHVLGSIDSRDDVADGGFGE